MTGRPDGSADHPLSALNLRLALSVFGVVVSVALAIVAWAADRRGGAVALGVLALVALVNAIVVQRRRIARRRTERGEGHHTLFE